MTAFELQIEASLAAIRDAGLDPKDIDGIIPIGITGAPAEAFVTNFGIPDLRFSALTPLGGASGIAAVQCAIAAIRSVEDGFGSPHHIVVVQAPEGYSRDLSYFVANPLVGDQIAYEVHPYNPAGDFDKLLVQPHQSLPIIIGEYGPAGSMTDADIMALWTVAQANEIPYIAWSFHARCEPSMLQDNASDGCGLDAGTGYDFPRTAWGDLFPPGRDPDLAE